MYAFFIIREKLLYWEIRLDDRIEMIIDAINRTPLMLAINRNGPIGDKSNNRPPTAVATKIPIAPKKELKPITVPRCLSGAS